MLRKTSLKLLITDLLRVWGFRAFSTFFVFYVHELHETSSRGRDAF